MSVLCVHALWEIFRDFVVAIAEHVSCAVCMHCGKISAISLQPLPESCECAMCVHALWENFRDFIAAVAEHVLCYAHALWEIFCDFVAAVAVVCVVFCWVLLT